MNIYARYFDNETITHSFDELLDFLNSLGEIPMNQALIDELDEYVNNDMPYPKRYKVRPRVYFILIKTNADTLEEFKSHRKGNEEGAPQPFSPGPMHRKEGRSTGLYDQREGWYLGSLNFKRVLLIPGTTKFQYRDTNFSAYVRANSPQHCYNRIVEHLKNRQDVDPRSQFPSAKGTNYHYEYVGEELK